MVLIGHSLGGVVIRQCIANALRINKLEPSEPMPAWLPNSEVRLFAPAHLGFEPSSYKALLFQLPKWGARLSSSLLFWRAYSDLRKDSTLLRDLRKRTETLAEENHDLRCLHPRLLYGRLEDVVVTGDFDCDFPPEFEDGVGHIGICKPSPRFLKPLEFVANDPLERTAAP
jgi:hypothetical protein